MDVENSSIVEPGAETPEGTASSSGEVPGQGGDADVLLNIPNLSVERVHVTGRDLQARVSLSARIGELFELHVGADVSMQSDVQVEVEKLNTQGVLKVNLERVADVIDRVMQTIETNPEILTRLVEARTSSEPGNVGEWVTPQESPVPPPADTGYLLEGDVDEDDFDDLGTTPTDGAAEAVEDETDTASEAAEDETGPSVPEQGGSETDGADSPEPVEDGEYATR